jgi:hypothetical protein
MLIFCEYYNDGQNKIYFRPFLGTIGFLNTTVSSYAGQTIYQFKDDNGTTLLTNKKKAEYNHLKVIKATYYPDSNIHSYSNWGQVKPLFYQVIVVIKMLLIK